MSYKHIIWDWNGTLLNDRWLSVEAINLVLSRRDLPGLTERRYLEIFTFPVIAYYRRLGFDFNKEPFSVVGTEFITEYTKRMYAAELHSGTRRLIEELTASGITHSLLSAASQQMLETLMDYHQLRSSFQKVVGQDNHYAYGKEDAGKLWMAEMDYIKEEVLFIGDTLHDLEVAKALGTNCVLLSHGHTSYQRLAETGEKVFNNYRELEEWFGKVLKFNSD
ncbi:MAG: HAD family hydrolase [Fidelibacterota bacterium]